jgi:hypothetical protein
MSTMDYNRIKELDTFELTDLVNTTNFAELLRTIHGYDFTATSVFRRIFRFSFKIAYHWN